MHFNLIVLVRVKITTVYLFFVSIAFIDFNSFTFLLSFFLFAMIIYYFLLKTISFKKQKKK